MNILWELFLVFAKIGAFTFGGGYAMIAMLDHECVERRGWITSDELMEITVIAESTPGPISINCATYTGYRQGGVVGAIIATVAIVLPSFALFYIIALFLEQFLTIPAIANAFRGIRVAVALLIVRSAIKMIRTLLKKTSHKKTSILLICVFFGVAFTANLLGLRISTVRLIPIGGILGLCIYGLPKSETSKGEGER